MSDFSLATIAAFVAVALELSLLRQHPTVPPVEGTTMRSQQGLV